MRAIYLTLATVLLSLSAQATSYTGIVTSRQACTDNNGKVFQKDLGCRALPLSNRTCNVTLNIGRNGSATVTVDIPEMKIRGEVATGAKLSGSNDGAYLYEHNFRAYQMNLSRVAFTEVQVSRGDVLLGLNVYTAHKEVAPDRRTFVQYSCGKMKMVKENTPPKKPKKKILSWR